MTNLSINVRKLWKSAVQARMRSYSPYSKFRVGAAFDSDRDVVSGCNIENASYGATVCAERIAIFKGLSEGKRPKNEMVIVTLAGGPTPPCGICLQVMAEFCPPSFRIWMASPKKIYGGFKLSEFLPHAFDRKQLRRIK